MCYLSGPQGSSILNEPLIGQIAHKSNKLYAIYFSIMWKIRIECCERSLCNIRWKFRACPFEWETQNFLWHRSNTVQWQIHCLLLIHTHTNTQAHPLYITLADKHTHTLTLSLISPVPLQWAHCSATLSHPHHIIEYRSLAFAAVCKRVCVWLGPSKVIAMATWAWGPLVVLSQSTGHRGHMKRGTRGGWWAVQRVVY